MQRQGLYEHQEGARQRFAESKAAWAKRTGKTRDAAKNALSGQSSGSLPEQEPPSASFVPGG
jgi:hypothetical protein